MKNYDSLSADAQTIVCTLYGHHLANVAYRKRLVADLERMSPHADVDRAELAARIARVSSVIDALGLVYFAIEFPEDNNYPVAVYDAEEGFLLPADAAALADKRKLAAEAERLAAEALAKETAEAEAKAQAAAGGVDNETTTPEGLEVGETHEAGTLRAHRYADSIRITDIANAGKRGKKCRELSVLPDSLWGSEAEKAALTRLGLWLRKVDNFDDAHTWAHVIAKDTQALKLNLRELRGVDVEPAGVRYEMDLRPADGKLRLSCSPHHFRLVRSDELGKGRPSYKGGPPMYQDSSYYSRNKACALRFYRWVCEHTAEVAKMATVAEFRSVWNSLGVVYDSHC